VSHRYSFSGASQGADEGGGALGHLSLSCWDSFERFDDPRDCSVSQGLRGAVRSTFSLLIYIPVIEETNFFNKAMRIGERVYIPTEMVELRAKQKSTYGGVIQHRPALVSILFLP